MTTRNKQCLQLQFLLDLWLVGLVLETNNKHHSKRKRLGRLPAGTVLMLEYQQGVENEPNKRPIKMRRAMLQKHPNVITASLGFLSFPLFRTKDKSNSLRDHALIYQSFYLSCSHLSFYQSSKQQLTSNFLNLI